MTLPSISKGGSHRMPRWHWVCFQKGTLACLYPGWATASAVGLLTCPPRVGRGEERKALQRQQQGRKWEPCRGAICSPPVGVAEMHASPWPGTSEGAHLCHAGDVPCRGWAGRPGDCHSQPEAGEFHRSRADGGFKKAVTSWKKTYAVGTSPLKTSHPKRKPMGLCLCVFF